MLERLRIRDLALLDEAEVEFRPGLNVVTGETGAGKSLLVQAASLLVGGRADADGVREGADATVVEGEFRLAGEPAARVQALLSEWELDFDGETLIVRREVQAGGRSRATVNQSPVTQTALRRLGEILADLHGQHEHQSLLREGAALLTLDRLAGLEAERARYAESLAALREAEGEHARLAESLATFAERRDYLAQAARELEEARLREGEEEDLAGESARLAHADRLRALAAEALDRLSEGERPAVESLAAAARALEQAAALDPSLTPEIATLREASIAAGETARAVADYASRLESDPAALEKVEARRDLYARLARKYRRSTPELIRWREELAVELAQGDDAEGSIERAAEKRRAREREARAAAEALSKRREAAAAEWSGRLTRELKPLGFQHARIAFEVARAEGERLGATGCDEVNLRFSANPGEAPRPLERIASGGELSRVMLSLKTALEAKDRVDLLLFDEVDSGIGGAVAQAVGERLRRLSLHRQVVCVTHLPMIASLAAHHLAVTKRAAGGRTVARIAALDRAGRIEELSRMLAGERVTETTRRQARELLGETPARSATR
ncbi:MAG TPA: DNA repair protein RecN [Candidatus Eisenbacteria bacterium]